MYIGVLQIYLQIPHSQSLKMKRQVANSLIMKLRERFKLAISEVDHHDTWQLLDLGIAIVGAQPQPLEATLNHILAAIRELEGNYVLLKHDKQIIQL